MLFRSRHDLAALTALVSDDCVFENPDPSSSAARYTGREELVGFLADFFTRYPQATMEVEDIFGFSIHCVMRWRYAFYDDSGSLRWIRGVDLFQVKNAKICEKLSYLKA